MQSTAKHTQGCGTASLKDQGTEERNDANTLTKINVSSKRHETKRKKRKEPEDEETERSKGKCKGAQLIYKCHRATEKKDARMRRARRLLTLNFFILFFRVSGPRVQKN